MNLDQMAREVCIALAHLPPEFNSHAIQFPVDTHVAAYGTAITKAQFIASTLERSPMEPDDMTPEDQQDARDEAEIDRVTTEAAIARGNVRDYRDAQEAAQVSKTHDATVRAMKANPLKVNDEQATRLLQAAQWLDTDTE